MAAFIKKLFKSKKTTEPATKPSVEQPTKDSGHQQDTRDILREQQRHILNGAPTQQQLATIAVEGVTAELRLKAAGQMTDAACLHQVQKQAKGKDKGVYQAVRQTLQRQKEEKAKQEALVATVTNLIRSATEQARSDDTKLYEARLDALLGQWKEVEQHATAEQTQEFLQASHRCQQRLDEIKQAKDDETRQHDQKEQRSETLQLLQSTLEDLRGHSPEGLPSLSSLDALQKTQENRWLEATRDTAVSDAEKKAYNSAMLTLRNYISAIRRITQHREALAALATAKPEEHAGDSDIRKQAQTLVDEINWPSGYPLPDILQPAHTLLKKSASTKTPALSDVQPNDAAIAELKQTIAKLESALESKQLKESRQLLKSAQAVFKDLNHRERKTFQARMQLLNGQVNELSDWLGFATEPKQITLCEQMEYLADQPMDPEAKAERIKELQKEWRELGGSSDRSLWTRFKEASDRAFEPCKDYFSAKSGLKQNNLETRKKICEELETFLSQADWSAMDWKGAEKIHQTARQEWKSAWPVEFRDNRPIQKRFDDLLKRLETSLDEERRKNETLKQAIVEKAQALVEHDPLQDAINQAKNLQKDWKAIGITRHREDRKLWQTFRSACDQIFARRDAQRSAHKEAMQVADESAKQALSAASQLNESNEDSALSDAQKSLSSLLGSEVSPGTSDQLKAEIQRLKKTRAHRALSSTIQNWQTLVDARTDGTLSQEEVPSHWPELAHHLAGADHGELVIRAEILSGVESPAEDQQRRMEIQVRRLADGMGSSEQSGSTMQELEKLVAGWCLVDTDHSPVHPLAQRMNQAIGALALP
ncbi:DUF349 domain-containing protein [Marinobacter sp. F4216]|uniref:DUF349 domain-containing protein n=1 Tax=Marinobacter sp. F4216 TaxID=2874281 RepID=UPI001CC02F0E|nr:DUF349 domain-containing protein [Marinobacter sp. F4216]MBZ2168219.1 DUF349 domain-containing protein [Marinobacter sp. F4216]